MENKRAKDLIDKYNSGLCSPDEKALVESWFVSLNPNEQKELTEADYDTVKQQLWANIQHARQPKPVRRLWPRIAAAASILAILGFGAYYYRTGKTQNARNEAEQIAPAQQGVTLTLAKGQQLQLKNKYSGQIAAGGETKISQQDSSLNYQANDENTKEPEMNTLANNGNSKFSVTLADGTEATLDIASTLTYPVAFTGGERKVTMTGQVYFNVKHKDKQRFLVSYKNQQAEDIGTRFNINAYDNEPQTKTTLIEGAIRVKLNSKPTGILLKPGEQATITGDEVVTGKANIEEVTAWLQSQLIFHHETLENIMRSVARIYKVTIVWQDPEAKKLTFGGSITRSEKLATVLNYFRKAGDVDFSVEGKTVKVFKKKKK